MAPHCPRGTPVAATVADDLVGLTLGSADRLADRPALIDAPSGRTLGFAELTDRFRSVAASLTDGGFRPGDVAATLTPNSNEWVVFALGAMAAGGTVSGMNPMLKPDEIARLLAVSGATVLAVAPPLLPMVERAGLDRLVRAVVALGDAPAGNAQTLAGLVRDGRAGTGRPAPAEIALLPFSSGTSGMPKAVEVPGRSVALAAASARRLLDLTPADVLMAVAPFFHVVGISGALAPSLALGLPLVIAPTPDLDAALGAIARNRVTVTVLTPPAIRAMLDHLALDRYDLSSLRALGCTAAPLSAGEQEALSRRIGVTVFQAYGMTESVSAISLGPLADPRPGSCGRPAPDFEVRVVDPDTGVDVPADTHGEIWIRSPMVMRGYRNDPAATAEALTPDGWLRSGDLGYVDGDGYLFIVDRLKELIKVGSSQVAPAELEAVIAAYPGVADVAVVGRPSPANGEVPIAFVVPGPGAPIDPDALVAWVAERVAPFKRIGAVEFVASIPRQPNGKIMRRLLAQPSSAAA